MLKIKKIVNKIKLYYQLYLSMLHKRDSELWVFGSWFGQKFADNPKYLFLYCVRMGMNVIWITKSEDVYIQLINQNLPVMLENSEEGKVACQHAKVAVYCCYISDISERYLGGAILINLWHGVPLKKIMWDDNVTRNQNAYSIKARVGRMMRKIPDRHFYISTTSSTFTQIYQSAFRLKKSHIIEVGQVRNDVFFNGSIKKRLYSNIEYKILVSYLPTHRNEGKMTMNNDVIFDLEKLEQFCEQNNILFLIKKHYYHNMEYTDLKKYPHIIDCTTRNDIDTQELMYNTDILITDYSSCYIDYLLLERPIIFYCFDYEKYLKNDREMYFRYEDVTPGERAKTFEDLIRCLEEILIDNEAYKVKQLKVKNLFFSEHNQRMVAMRLVQEINKILCT